jgi:hypothetical protein
VLLQLRQLQDLSLCLDKHLEHQLLLKDDDSCSSHSE